MNGARGIDLLLLHPLCPMLLCQELEMANGGYDVVAARQYFPALNKQQVFFDNAGGSQTLGDVVES